MDTRFWGPSGWQLFHLITFEKGMLSAKKQLFGLLKDILPCKYCRESAVQFTQELPMNNNLALWMYDYHEKVNQKLHNQHITDPKVPEPIPSPPFEEVVQKYKKMLNTPPTEIPGRDFLYSIAYNYTPEHRSAHEKFWDALIKVFPYYQYRKRLIKPDLSSSETYLKDVNRMLGDQSLVSIQRTLRKYKAKCKKTCRRKGGRLFRTRRIL